MQVVDLSKLLKNKFSRWVAVSADYKTILAEGDSIKEVSVNLNKTGKKGILVPVSDKYESYVL